MAHPDPHTAARNALVQLQTWAAGVASETLSPMAAREIRDAMPDLADFARTAALVSIAESLHTIATRTEEE
ncbi:hypothetical protein [Verrucosispora sp. TAA-831]|uniref:hypothetical protein n=1 Tax=Verrucosispora sp. TAA-831 TaxID=3422227 RepID=UPI003D6FBACC